MPIHEKNSSLIGLIVSLGIPLVLIEMVLTGTGLKGNNLAIGIAVFCCISFCAIELLQKSSTFARRVLWVWALTVGILQFALVLFAPDIDLVTYSMNSFYCLGISYIAFSRSR